MKLYRIQNPFILTIFGASGDLAKLKLFPALYDLMEQRRLPEQFYIVGFARTQKSQAEFKKEFEQAIREKRGRDISVKLLQQLSSKVFYFSGQYDQLGHYQDYQKYLQKLSKSQKLTHIAYLSVPPQTFKPIIQNLGESKMSSQQGVRIVIEKPFGEDFESAQELFHFLARYFDEEHIYLLDHYLGKSAVQSILTLRHSNRVLNYLLKGSEIANIQITAFEDIGVDNRLGYFDQVGIMKDMVQSHLLQMLALTTMSIPITESATSLHREKYSILSALNFPRSNRNVVLGQYQSYRKQESIVKHSKTETFVALRLFIDRETWFRVPIYIRAGKKLHEKHTYIAIEFKKFDFQNKTEKPNILTIELHPQEKMTIRLLNKNDMGETHYSTITSLDSLACSGDDCLPEHAMLLLDVMRGRKLHFLSFPEILAAWTVTDTILATIRKQKIPVEIYKDNSAGPASQDRLTKVDHFEWHDLH